MRVQWYTSFKDYYLLDYYVMGGVHHNYDKYTAIGFSYTLYLLASFFCSHSFLLFSFFFTYYFGYFSFTCQPMWATLSKRVRTYKSNNVGRTGFTICRSFNLGSMYTSIGTQLECNGVALRDKVHHNKSPCKNTMDNSEASASYLSMSIWKMPQNVRIYRQ